MSVTLLVSQPEISPLNELAVAQYPVDVENRPDMSVAADVSQVDILPYKAAALAGSLHQAFTWSCSVVVQADAVKEPELLVNISAVVAEDASKHTAMLKAVAPLNI